MTNQIIDFGTVKQGAAITKTFTWPLAADETPDDITGYTVTATAHHKRTGDVTNISGTFTVTDGAARTVAWAMTSSDTGTYGDYGICVTATDGSNIIKTLYGELVIEKDESVNASQNPPLVGVPTAAAAYLTSTKTAGEAAIENNFASANASGVWVDSGSSASSFDAAGSAAAAQAAAEATATASDKTRQEYQFISVTDFSDDIATALAYANTNNIPVVKLQAGQTYTLSSKITIPAQVTLIGVEGNTALARRPIIETNNAITMIEFGGWSAGLKGVFVDGNNAASIGVHVNNQAFTNIEDVTFFQFGASAVALKYTQSLYPTLKRVLFSGVSGTQIDATDFGGSYFGINDGYFEQIWCQGSGRALRLNGKLTAVNFNVENTTTLAVPNISIAEDFQSELSIYGGYYEGASSANGFIAPNGGKIYLYGGQYHGDGAVGGIFIKGTIGGLTLHPEINDWDIGLSGSASNNAMLNISPNWVDVNDPLGSFSTAGASGLSGMICNPGGFHEAADGAITGDAVLWDVDSLGAAIDLSKGNVFRVYSVGGTPTTVTPTNARAGHHFSITTSDANITLRHGDGSARFTMATGANVTLPANVRIDFAVDYTNRPRELGDYSRRLTQAYTITNDTTDRTFDANATTLDELADVLATLIKDLGMG